MQSFPGILSAGSDVDATGLLTILQGEKQTEHPIRIRSISGYRLLFECSEPVPLRVLCKVVHLEKLVLGEIVVVHKGEGSPVYTLHIHHALRNTDIQQIHEKWLGK